MKKNYVRADIIRIDALLNMSNFNLNVWKFKADLRGEKAKNNDAHNKPLTKALIEESFKNNAKKIRF